MHQRVDRRVEEPRYGTVLGTRNVKKDVGDVNFELGATRGRSRGTCVFLRDAAIPGT